MTFFALVQINILPLRLTYRIDHFSIIVHMTLRCPPFSVFTFSPQSDYELFRVGSADVRIHAIYPFCILYVTEHRLGTDLSQNT